MPISTLKHWIDEAGLAEELLAHAFFQQVEIAYDEDFEYQLTTGHHRLRDKLACFPENLDWKAAFLDMYHPSHPIRNLAEIASWRREERENACLPSNE